MRSMSLHLQTSNTEEEKLTFEASTHMSSHLCNAIREKCTTYRKEINSLEFSLHKYRLIIATEQFTLEQSALNPILTVSRRWSSCHFCVSFAIRSLSSSKKFERYSNSFIKGALQFKGNCSNNFDWKARKTHIGWKQEKLILSGGCGGTTMIETFASPCS
jgi:hypothetical protein